MIKKSYSPNSSFRETFNENLAAHKAFLESSKFSEFEHPNHPLKISLITIRVKMEKRGLKNGKSSQI